MEKVFVIFDERSVALGAQRTESVMLGVYGSEEGAQEAETQLWQQRLDDDDLLGGWFRIEEQEVL